ncbi:hypothetical protein [Myceligenerans pegani]|uniref:DUF1499 domain-containing protein n=1 Tax=Myceligenerans pegani TaxID=2776917 RepID=A0ABR9MZZ5_9MICO|nr:hypothetical protein [Myceligenerans sp. TRM 65318]MBE1876596.1 hypothetical protein [Myceligenerans sp. TRM 65318]MBE3018867.1 hypothetical protein [Myceligenerans sp. TRM 65318]
MDDGSAADGSAATALLLGLPLLLVLLFVAGRWQTILAKRPHETIVDFGPEHVHQIVDKTFGRFLWDDVDGPGDINKRRLSLNDRPVVISIDVTELEDGRTHVLAQMTRWSENGFGMIGSRGHHLAKKVIRRLENAQGK